MNAKFLYKTLLALVLTLAVIFSSGVVMEKTGVALVPSAYACGAGSGGGC
jgi:hypothetical protein